MRITDFCVKVKCLKSQKIHKHVHKRWNLKFFLCPRMKYSVNQFAAVNGTLKEVVKFYEKSNVLIQCRHRQKLILMSKMEGI